MVIVKIKDEINFVTARPPIWIVKLLWALMEIPFLQSSTRAGGKWTLKLNTK